MKKFFFFTSILFICLGCKINEGDEDKNPEITSTEIQNHINFLASDELEGRFTASDGAETAAEYIEEDFERTGLKPLWDDEYFQEFPFVASLELANNNRLQFKINDSSVGLELKKEYITSPFSGTAQIKGKIVFAGYGISAKDLNYDDYAGMDVKGKTVVIMRYNPEGENPHSEFDKYSAYRYKASLAKEKGAAAVIFVSGYIPEDNEDKLMKLAYDIAGGIDSLAIVQAKREIIDKLFKAENLDFKEYQKKINDTKTPSSFEFKNSLIEIETGVKEINKVGKNVAGFIEGNDPLLKDEYVIIGAHYDHLGYGETGSLYRGDSMQIHNGADDNASGTAGILELAEKIYSFKDQLKRSVVFIAFAGEELGLLGSSYFVKNSPIDLNKIAAMINLDMIGRMEEKKLIIYGTATSTKWKDLLNKGNEHYNFKLTLNDEGYGPSDHSSFYGKNIPVLFFFTGTHTDYHRPSDDADKINSKEEETILKYVFETAFSIDTSSSKPDYVNVPRKEGERPVSFKVYVGTIPDYSEKVDGLKITGVSEGSPAQKGGLKGGDIIISFGGKKISNIYDYTYALADHTPGEIVDVIVLRNGEKVELQVKLGAR